MPVVREADQGRTRGRRQGGHWSGFPAPLSEVFVYLGAEGLTLGAKASLRR